MDYKFQGHPSQFVVVDFSGAFEIVHYFYTQRRNRNQNIRRRCKHGFFRYSGMLVENRLAKTKILLFQLLIRIEMSTEGYVAPI